MHIYRLFIHYGQSINSITRAFRKPRRSLQTDHSSNNAVLLLETEKTLQHIFNALDGVSDFEKNKVNYIFGISVCQVNTLNFIFMYYRMLFLEPCTM